MLNLSDLIVFLKAAECGNFSETGRHLRLSQPAISQRIENLQKHFQTRLFQRDGRSMRLTEAGQVLKPMAKELIVMAQHIDDTMISLRGEVMGEMTIGCSTDSGKYLLPGLIAAYRKEFPKVRVDVHTAGHESVMGKLLAGDVDFGIFSRKSVHRQLEYLPLIRDDLVLIAPMGHRWSKRASISPDDILQEPIILQEESAGTRAVLMRGLAEHGITLDMLKVAMVLGNAEAVEMAVEQGIGVAFISRLAAARWIALGCVSEILVEGMALRRDIFLAQSNRNTPTRAQREFWNFAWANRIRTERPAAILKCEHVV